MATLILGRRKQRLYEILLLCSSTVAALLLAETVLQFALPNSYYIQPPHFKRVSKPRQDRQDIAPGISGESRFATNSRGVRGDELTSSHTHRILAIGGSTTGVSILGPI